MEKAQRADREARQTAEAVARRGYGKLVALLAARTRDVSAAEDALSEAFATALAAWTQTGCPANPEGWLLTAARRRLVDQARRRQTSEASIPLLQVLSEEIGTSDGDEIFPDRRLALLFVCAHPAIDVAVRAPLMLQVVLGLDAQRIASAFLVSPAAMGKRLGRAKEKIRQACIPFRVPEREELPERLASVLDAIYTAFAEGWADPLTSDQVRSDLTAEALFLARLVTELLPDEPEAQALLALLLYAHARRHARRDANGDYVPLAEQDLSLWDGAMIAEAESLLLSAGKDGSPGRYRLEAALQSAHVHRRRTGRPNWSEIVQLYDVLDRVTGSAVVRVNRALAIAELQGAAAGLRALPDAGAHAKLAEYQPYWAARADLLARMGARDDARNAYERAIGLERDDAVRRFLQRRKTVLQSGGP